MRGYNRKENTHNEPMILEPEDWTTEEYAVLQKLFGCPRGTTRIKLTYSVVEWFEEGEDHRNSDKEMEELVKYLDRNLGGGYEDYVKAHLGEAIDVVRRDNCIIDLDNIVHLQRVLGFNISHELYTYIDAQYDGSLLDVTDEKELLGHIWKYLQNEGE